jgi:hypothetical protein
MPHLLSSTYSRGCPRMDGIGLVLSTEHHNYRTSFSGRGPIHRTQKGLDESSPYTGEHEVRPYKGTGSVFMAHCP